MAMTREGRRKLDEMRVKDPQLELPWGGRSPRGLTRAAGLFRLSLATAPIEENGEWDESIIEEQNRRFFHGS